MPNDDLGQFPSPTTPTPQADNSQATSDSGTSSLLNDIKVPATPEISTESFTTPPQTNISEQSPTFEVTPDVIPSAQQEETTPTVSSQPTTPTVSTPATTETPPQTVTSQDIPATVTPKGGSAFGSLISIILLLVAGSAIAASVILYSQSQQLKQQIQEITQTLEKQKAAILPTPTPFIEFTTPTPEPESTISATPTPILTPTPTATTSSTNLPLSLALQALKVGINHQPNAQLILIKTEGATQPQTAVIKYFFRQDLTTKKYFYISIINNKEPEIVDQAIYVTPDNNIPSLNETTLGGKLGIDLDEAHKIALGLCNSGLCQNANLKAQYIKSSDTFIWQLTYDPTDTTKSDLIIQINAQTKEVLYKSTGF